MIGGGLEWCDINGGWDVFFGGSVVLRGGGVKVKGEDDGGDIGGGGWKDGCVDVG